jgi:DNA invertase Pin-like site-specific DNA recombinase
MANDPTRILVRQMMGAVAQYEKSQIVLKLRGARLRKRAKEGRCEGRKPYGFYAGEDAVFERLKALLAAAGEGAILAVQRGPCRQCRVAVTGHFPG